MQDPFEPHKSLSPVAGRIHQPSRAGLVLLSSYDFQMQRTTQLEFRALLNEGVSKGEMLGLVFSRICDNVTSSKRDEKTASGCGRVDILVDYAEDHEST
jgi:hypothetical protein